MRAIARPRGARLAGALAGVAALGLAFGCGDEASAPAPATFFGVVPQVQPSAEDFRLMAEDHVGIVRQLFNWAEIEAYEGAYDWSEIDQAVGGAADAGIEIFPVLYGTAGWAQSAQRNATCGVTCAPSTDEARRGFARFAAAAVERYGRGGSFWGQEATEALPIEAWQVWNEQNSSKYFGPRVNVSVYARLLEAASPAIRGADPEAEVIVGGMWGPPGTDAVTPTLDYVERLYAFPGIARHFDAIAVNPYASELSTVVDQIGALRGLLERLGDTATEMWVTELGWASDGDPGEPLVKSEEEQAELLEAAYRVLIGRREEWRLRSVHWYSWRDTPPDVAICGWCPQSGLRTEDGDEKPAGAAFRELAG